MANKTCPVDRGKLLIGLECCKEGTDEKCRMCPYFDCDCDVQITYDSLAYINYLEEMNAEPQHAE